MLQRLTIKQSIILCLLLLTGLAILLYGQTLDFKYVWDDPLLFLDKTTLINNSLSWSLLSEPVLAGTTYLRPLVFLTFYVEFNLFSQSPALSHAINLAIFIANIWLVFILCLQVLRLQQRTNTLFLAMLAALFYTTHPALVESTVWVSGRFDSMVTLFILAACVTYFSKTSQIVRIVLICLFFMAALLSKELGALLPAVLICLWFACYNSSRNTLSQSFLQALRDNVLLLIAMFITLSIYVYLRQQAMPSFYHGTLDEQYRQWAWLENRLPLQALQFYLKQATLPFSSVSPLHPLSELETHTLKALIIDICTGFALLCFFIYALIKRTSASWLCMASLALITPVLYIVPIEIAGNIGHERFMTAPLALLVVALVVIDYSSLFNTLKSTTRNYTLITLSSLWLLLAAWTSYSTASFWQSDLTLWNWALHSHSDSQLARYNYLYGALSEDRIDLVEQEINKQLAKNTGLEVGDQLLYANMLIRKGDIEGMHYLEGVLYALPKFHEMPEGQKEINSFLLTALQMAGAYNDYANSLLVFKGDAENALEYNKIAEFYLTESEKIPLYYTRVAIYYALGLYAEAEKLYQSLEPLYYNRKEQIKRIIPQLLMKFCQQPASNKNICAELMKKNIINATDLSRPN